MTVSITGKTKIFGLLGYPVSHTFSPPIQNVAFQANKIDAAYLPFEVHPDNLKSAIEGIRSLQFAGVNVTIPHKINVLPYLDEITPTAARIGAVNTIRNDRGKLLGTNTDGSGLLRSLSALSFSPKDQTVVILGAGGSTRSILVAFAEKEAKRIFLVNRTWANAQLLVEEYAPLYPETEFKVESLENLFCQAIDLLLNTTSVGMKKGESPVDLAKFESLERVADIIYSPQQSSLLKQAEHLKIPYINGTGMLLFQGIEAFEFWTSQPAPISLMEQKLLKLLNG
ncbi:MAG: shikimate dehydrogenase [SAR324 cluster bacterium]|nr:shikimate dehydrogenase [SAR324 cluster bacterium]